MTGREWLFSLSNEEISHFFMVESCRVCSHRKGRECVFYHEPIRKKGLNKNTCKDRLVQFLNSEVGK